MKMMTIARNKVTRTSQKWWPLQEGQQQECHEDDDHDHHKLIKPLQPPSTSWALATTKPY